jgi:hypothetical protein
MSIYISKELENKINLDDSKKNSNCIDEVLSIESIDNKIYVTYIYNNTNILKKNIIMSSFILNDKQYFFNIPLAFKFDSLKMDINYKIRLCKIFIDEQKFWEQLR